MLTSLERPSPWTEHDYFALGESLARVELIDGSLLVSGGRTVRHQHLSGQLRAAFYGPARQSGLGVYGGVNVRLGTDRIVIPDLVVTDTDDGGTVVDADEVRLIGEVVSANSAVTDRVTKMHLYAEAGIPLYLLAEGDATLRLFRLWGERYSLEVEAGAGQVLRLREPVAVDVAVGLPFISGG